MPDESSKRPQEDDIDIESLVRALKRYLAEVRDDRRLDGAMVRTATVESRLCGSHLTLDAEVRDGRIEQIGAPREIYRTPRQKGQLLIGQNFDYLDNGIYKLGASGIAPSRLTYATGCDRRVQLRALAAACPEMPDAG